MGFATTCATCGEQNAPGNAFCHRCGTSLTPPEPFGQPGGPIAAPRRGGALAIAVLGLIVVGAVAGFMLLRDGATGTPEGTPSIPGPAATQAVAGCDPVERPAVMEATHISEGAEHEPYSSNPPSSGPHYAVPADPGFHTQSLPAEQLVHNLEHGQVVIWYSPNLQPADLAIVQSVTDSASPALVADPYPGLDTGHAFVLTAWGALQSCSAVSEAAINDFRAQFQGRGPENVGVPTYP